MPFYYPAQHHPAEPIHMECGPVRRKEIGIRSAYITGYTPAAIALYGCLGAVDELKSFVYENTGDRYDQPA
jgi:hypothetical protein